MGPKVPKPTCVFESAAVPGGSYAFPSPLGNSRSIIGRVVSVPPDDCVPDGSAIRMNAAFQKALATWSKCT